MRKLIVLALIMAVAGVVYGEGISWFANDQYMYYANGSTYLDGNSDSSLGCFVQLIWTGPDNEIDTAYLDGGDGTSMDDDVVVDWRWMGSGLAGGADGWFSGGDVVDGGNIQSDRWYYARAWTAPADSYSAGDIPTSPTNKYGNSPTWQYPKSDPVRDGFDVTDSSYPQFTTSLSPLAIPEPAVLALGLIGLISIRLLRRRG